MGPRARFVAERVPLPWRRRLAVLAGGAMGTALRILVSATVATTGVWPWATLLENVSGSLLLGYVFTRLLLAAPRTTLTIPLVCTGVLGSYTTFSTFVVEIARVNASAPSGLAVGYATASVVVGLAAAQLGIHLAERR